MIVMVQTYFEIFIEKGKDPEKQKYRFRFRAPNGEIIAASEAYESKQNCKDGIEAVRTYAKYATIQDLTLKPT